MKYQFVLKKRPVPPRRGSLAVPKPALARLPQQSSPPPAQSRHSPGGPGGAARCPSPAAPRRPAVGGPRGPRRAWPAAAPRPAPRGPRPPPTACTAAGPAGRPGRAGGSPEEKMMVWLTAHFTPIPSWEVIPSLILGSVLQPSWEAQRSSQLAIRPG